jgi:hypothetical protein
MSLEEAIEHAAENLPDYWAVHVVAEKDSGWVYAEEPDGSIHVVDIGPESLEDQVMAAVAFAQKNAEDLEEEFEEDT